jgi:hypothetical protein
MLTGLFCLRPKHGTVQCFSLSSLPQCSRARMLLPLRVQLSIPAVRTFCSGARSVSSKVCSAVFSPACLQSVTPAVQRNELLLRPVQRSITSVCSVVFC